MSAARVNLFVYGSLRQAEVQRALFGREVAAIPDLLAGYALGWVTIDDPDVVAKSGSATHRIVEATGDPADRVEGWVLTLNPAELAAADAYETKDYARVAVRLESGIEGFVYARPGAAP
jgi:gamma-glutamylcyclotransferase (GGCT)/AIG2-like uncharacterized protein YtfP